MSLARGEWTKVGIQLQTPFPKWNTQRNNWISDVHRCIQQGLGIYLWSKSFFQTEMCCRNADLSDIGLLSRPGSIKFEQMQNQALPALLSCVLQDHLQVKQFYSLAASVHETYIPVTTRSAWPRRNPPAHQWTCQLHFNKPFTFARHGATSPNKNKIH